MVVLVDDASQKDSLVLIVAAANHQREDPQAEQVEAKLALVALLREKYVRLVKTSIGLELLPALDEDAAELEHAEHRATLVEEPLGAVFEVLDEFIEGNELAVGASCGLGAALHAVPD